MELKQNPSEQPFSRKKIQAGIAPYIRKIVEMGPYLFLSAIACLLTDLALQAGYQEKDGSDFDTFLQDLNVLLEKHESKIFGPANQELRERLEEAYLKHLEGK